VHDDTCANRTRRPGDEQSHPRGHRWSRGRMWQLFERLTAAASAVSLVVIAVSAASVVWTRTAEEDEQAGNDAVASLDGPRSLTIRLEPPLKGHPGARIGVVEFTDFECPFCARYATGTHRRIERDYVDAGKIAYSVRHLPLEPAHPRAFRASEAAECAEEQGKYWQMYDRLFASPDRLAPSELVGHGKAIGLATARFSECLAQGRPERVRADIVEADRLGITATPTFLLGMVGQESQLTVMRIVRGAVSPSVLKDVIDELLIVADEAQ
jgi:protein-disulfide isomerase